MSRFPTLLFIFAFLSLFFFPWGMSAVVTFITALFLPVVGIAFGIILDALYLPPHTLPLATIAGALGSVIALFVRQFVKTRIMSR